MNRMILLRYMKGMESKYAAVISPSTMIPVVELTLRSILKEFSDTFEDKYRKELKDYEHFSGSFTNIKRYSRILFYLI